MSDIVISAHSLSKQYRLGPKVNRSDTLWGTIGAAARAPLRNFRQIRNMTRNSSDDETLFWALRNVNFKVRQGDVLGIVGYNGAGKSTLLKILSRITDPTAGEVQVRGRVSALLEVGTGFHPELSGRENVFMNGTILGMTRREIASKFDEIVAFSGIERHIDTPVKFYSSGMKVRLAFAVAAHLEPELLVVDEVLAVGDIEFQQKCMGKMQDVAGQGRTVLFVSHNLNAVMKLCSRGLLLQNGQVAMDASARQVVDAYMSSKQSNIATQELQGGGVLAAFASNGQGERQELFHFDDAITLNFALGDVEPRSMLGFAVQDEFERRVFIDQVALPPKCSQATVTATIPGKHLTPGKYNLSVSLMSPYNKTYWLASNALGFEVSRLASKYEHLKYDYGVVNVDLVWNV